MRKDDNSKWGVCLDIETYSIGLYQKVVQYKVDDVNKEAWIMLPKNFKLGKEKIKELSLSPLYTYEEKVSHYNHMEVEGVVVNIYWHSNLECFYYHIKIGEKIKSKRYFERDLVSCSTQKN